MVQNKWKPAFVALTIVLFAWCAFLILHSGSVVGVVALAILGLSLLVTSRAPSKSADRTEFGLHEVSTLDHSHAELHELQRTLCTLEIDLENDISRLSRRYADIKF